MAQARIVAPTHTQVFVSVSQALPLVRFGRQGSQPPSPAPATAPNGTALVPPTSLSMRLRTFCRVISSRRALTESLLSESGLKHNTRLTRHLSLCLWAAFPLHPPFSSPMHTPRATGCWHRRQRHQEAARRWFLHSRGYRVRTAYHTLVELRFRRRVVFVTATHTHAYTTLSPCLLAAEVHNPPTHTLVRATCVHHRYVPIKKITEIKGISEQKVCATADTFILSPAFVQSQARCPPCQRRCHHHHHHHHHLSSHRVICSLVTIRASCTSFNSLLHRMQRRLPPPLEPPPPLDHWCFPLSMCSPPYHVFSPSPCVAESSYRSF